MQAFLLTGANLGDREGSLQKAMELIELKCGQIIQTSAIYETAAWGKEDQPSFLNQAIEIDTQLEPENLMDAVLEIESAMGRSRGEKFGARIIDIDIIFYAQAVLDTRKLKLPHPHMQNRRFVLVPLAEIASSFIHPVLGTDVAGLLKKSKDKLPVHKFG